jgi:AcrR family transcriptional regulator
MSSPQPTIAVDDLVMDGAVASSISVAPASTRGAQKQATRKRVVAAARELFDTQGYQGTTIRDILSQVMQDRLDGLYAELDRVMPHLRGGTPERLRTMFAIHFAFESRHTRLFLAHIAAAYDWTLPPTAKPMGRTPRLQEIIRECLIKGAAEGDVDGSADLQEVVDLLLAAYAWVYRLAAWNDADAAAMTAVMDRQIGLIAAGFTPR